VFIKGTTQGLDAGDSLDVLTRNASKGKFQPAGEVTVNADGSFRWTSANTKKTWIRVTDGSAVSNTVIVPAR
jgi:VCBS repeat-containing protein